MMKESNVGQDYPCSCSNKPCVECPLGFEVLELRNTGLVIYLHSTKPGNECRKIGTGKDQVDGNSFIFHNTKGEDVTSQDFLPEMEKRADKCSRCRNIMGIAVKFLKQVSAISKNETLGICNHCKLKKHPCNECNDVLKKFFESKKNAQDSARTRVREWLTSIESHFKDFYVDEQSMSRERLKDYIDKYKRTNKKSTSLRARSEVCLDQLYRQKKVRIERDLEIRDLCYQSEEQDLVIQPPIATDKSKKIIIFKLEDQLDITRSISTISFYRRTKSAVPDTTQIPTWDDGQLDTLRTGNKDKYTEKDNTFTDKAYPTSPKKQRDYYEDSILPHVLYTTPEYAHSAEKRWSSGDDLIDDIRNSDFIFSFPSESKKVEEYKKQKSSSELIADIHDRIQEKNEEIRLKKIEEEKIKQRTLQEKNQLAEEKKKLKEKMLFDKERNLMEIKEGKLHKDVSLLGKIKDEYYPTDKISKSTSSIIAQQIKLFKSEVDQRDSESKIRESKTKTKEIKSDMTHNSKAGLSSKRLKSVLDSSKLGIKNAKSAPDVKSELKLDSKHRKNEAKRHSQEPKAETKPHKTVGKSEDLKEFKTDSKPHQVEAKWDTKGTKPESKQAKTEIKSNKAATEIHSKQPGGESKQTKADSKLPKAELKESKAESKQTKSDTRESKVDSKQTKAKLKESNAESKQAKLEAKIASREPKPESKESRANQRETERKIAQKDVPESKQAITELKSNKTASQVHSKQPEGGSKEPKADSKQPKAELKESKAESKQTKSDTREPKVDSKPTKAKLKEFNAESKQAKLEAKTESKESRANQRDTKIDPNKLIDQTKQESKGPKGETKDSKAETKQSKTEPKDYKSQSKESKGESKHLKTEFKDAKLKSDYKASESKNNKKVSKLEKVSERPSTEIGKKEKTDINNVEKDADKAKQGKEVSSIQKKTDIIKQLEKPKKDEESLIKHGKDIKARVEFEERVPRRQLEAQLVAAAQGKQKKDIIASNIKMLQPSQNLLVLNLVKVKAAPKRTLSQIMTPSQIYLHEMEHKIIKSKECPMCINSNLELEYDIRKKDLSEQKEMIKGRRISCLPSYTKETTDQRLKPILFQIKYDDKFRAEIIQPPKHIPAFKEYHEEKKPIDSLPEEETKGVIRYALSDRTFIDKGWTMLPTEKIVRKMNVYRMRPAHPEFDWFERHRGRRFMTYDSGERLAEFDDDGRGRWYYRNQRLALQYYDAEELNAQQRFVIFSNGEPDDRGRSRPYTVLATFDYLGNGIVFDHGGKIRMKYNQTEGVVLDRNIGPVTHWKWHTLNDPPVLQQVMIDTHLSYKDPEILKMSAAYDNQPRQDNEDMLAIEFDNFIKEKGKKLTQKFKPFQIKMKALKINEHFSLKVLDQANVYLIYRDGTTNIKLNLGMLLDHREIVDTDTAEVGEVVNNMERLPARTDSLAAMQKSVAYAQHFEKNRTERERRLQPPVTAASADQLAAAASRPLQPPLFAASSTATSSYTTSRRPSNNLYYDNRLF